ncbi:asparagine synthase (glutamine-hydrolyzing) [Photobacterium lutimaris]|uniref:asparagine synthase (glutamine-hydrolyzing) n=1 Tax=Photobacterium lutimaris TaxID=388278 RepID=A0A2T3IY48_9GAMM|nr:asparagine synthase (glutamine-hydrolyzing) [Photobacterium lutimaris]PSU33525.1 asparagine synthase (glutamine-hydrolyzing) [Photobacterium lutimaris]TDR74641.1 asparagine synthase (glutamine-hydrolysing) [Photobacterium lutimaris]
MCGLYLSIADNLIISDEFNSFSKLKHRGPDNSLFKFGTLNEFTKVKNVAYGFHRLSINDLHPKGDQPFYSHDGSFVIVNGEIYNYEKIVNTHLSNFKFQSTSDCEVILPLYKKYDLDFINLLEGEFSLIIYDASKNKFVIARDSVGVRPLYYSYDKDVGFLTVASELKAITTSHVKHFPPGHIATLNRHFTLDIDKYYDPNSIRKKDCATSTEELAKAVRGSLHNAVKTRLKSDVPVGCLLSGGLDSSGVAALAASMSETPLKTFTLKIDGLPNDDIKYAKIVAEKIGSEHHEISTSLPEIYGLIDHVIKVSETYNYEMVPNLVLIYLVAQYVAHNTDVKVLLDGTGPDEMLGGYWFFKDAPSVKEFDEETFKQLSEMHRTELLGERVISHFGLEVRYPYLDRKVQQELLSTPANFKHYTDNHLEKFILRKALTSDLPAEIISRKKLGMTHGAGEKFENIFDQEIRKRLGNSEVLNCLSHDRIVGTENYYQNIFFGEYPNAKDVECGVTPAWWRSEDPLAIWR